MSDLGRVLVVIPARGGSKRLPRKNVLDLAGKPLICWSIESALSARLNGRVLVTSESEEVLSIARCYESQGVVAYKRPSQLATDSTEMSETLIDVVNAEREAGRDWKTLVLLQPTSPLRKAEDILAAIQTYVDCGCRETVVTICEVDYPSAWVGTITGDSQLSGLDTMKTRSQDHQKEYRLNGAVYVVSIDFLTKNATIFTEELRASIMPKERSVDIDEAIDFRVCEHLLSCEGLV